MVELCITTAIGALGFIPGVAPFTFTAGVFTGVLLVMPTTKENIARDLYDVTDRMNNNEHAILEFKEEIVYDTITDYINKNESSRKLFSLKSWASTGTRHIATSNLAAYLGL